MLKTVVVATTLSVAFGARVNPEDHTTFTDFEAIVKHVNQVSVATGKISVLASVYSCSMFRM